MKSYKISFAGAGNVASTLCRSFYENGNTIDHISSRNEKNGRRLAGICHASWSDDLVFPGSTEIIIIAVPDHNIHEVAEMIRCDKSVIVAHTAGAIGLDVFPLHFMNTGIIYPLQTFSPGRKPDLSQVPFFIEGSDEFCAEKLKELAESVTRSVFLSNTTQRRLLHLAAVFACNFTNHMLTIGKDLSDKSGIPFDVFRSLILETINKAVEIGPEKSQTGPAIRYDINTIEKHLDLLSYSPELKNIYDLMTRSIISYHKKK